VNGRFTLPFTDAAGASEVALAVQPDQRIVVAGAIPSGGVALTRYLANGAPDPGFGPNGASVVTGSEAGIVRDHALIAQRNGKLVVSAHGENRSTIVRLRSDGSIDSRFGSRGRVTVREVTLSTVVAQRNGKLVAGGVADDGTAFAVMRLTSGGKRDGGFGQRGIVMTDTDAPPQTDHATTPCSATARSSWRGARDSRTSTPSWRAIAAVGTRRYPGRGTR
jgi:uncharacterized delta-60 repeat protein